MSGWARANPEDVDEGWDEYDEPKDVDDCDEPYYEPQSAFLDLGRI